MQLLIKALCSLPSPAIPTSRTLKPLLASPIPIQRDALCLSLTTPIIIVGYVYAMRWQPIGSDISNVVSQANHLDVHSVTPFRSADIERLRSVSLCSVSLSLARAVRRSASLMAVNFSGMAKSSRKAGKAGFIKDSIT